MTVLTVLLAPEGVATGVLDVLTDLSGAGLVGPFLWVRADDMALADITATAVDGGRRTTTTVQNTLITSRLTRIRIGVLVPLQESAAVVSSSAEVALRQLAESTSGGATVTPVRCLLTRQGSTARPDTSARQGWHNILIAPEDSQGPGQGLSLLPASTDPVEIGRHAAPVIAGLLGLWAGADGCCLDDLTIPPGERLRAARAFYRRVDADDVEAELRRRVLATRPELPLPRERSIASVYIEHPPSACGQMAANLWAKHPHVLEGPREPRPPVKVDKIRFWQALKWLFGFIWAALRNAPEEWFQRIATQAAATAARGAQRAIFGQGDAAYNVIVRGMLPDGRPASWQDVARASGELDGFPSDGARPIAQEARTDLSALWKDYVGGALTLADGGLRGGDQMPPATAGPNRAVLRLVDDCVPTKDADFQAVSPSLADRTGIGRLQVGDVLGADQLGRGLYVASQDQSMSGDASTTLQNLQKWRSRHEGTYATHVGNRIYQQIQKTVAEIGDHLAFIDAAAREDPDAEGRAWRARLARRIAVGIFVGIVVAGVIWLLATAFKVVSITAAVWTTVAVVVVWILGGVLCYVRSQQRLFQALNRRQELVNEVKRTLANLRHALRDLRRLAEVYGQFLPWTRNIGVVLGSPHGPEPAPEPGRVPIMWGLPNSTRVAGARIDEATLSEAAVLLRRELYHTGWLAFTWQANLNDAPRRLGSAGLDLLDNPAGIFDLQGRPLAGSPLEQWTRILLDEGASSATGAAAWGKVRELLEPSTGPWAQRGERLLSSVAVVGHGEPPPGPLSTFLSNIADTSGAQQRFHSNHFTAEGIAADAPAVRMEAPEGRRIGLSRIRVMVQLSEALDPWWFQANQPPIRHPYRPEDPPPADPATNGRSAHTVDTESPPAVPLPPDAGTF